MAVTKKFPEKNYRLQTHEKFENSLFCEIRTIDSTIFVPHLCLAGRWGNFSEQTPVYRPTKFEKQPFCEIRTPGYTVLRATFAPGGPIREFF